MTDLPRIAAAMDCVRSADRLADLEQRIADGWAAARERKLGQSIGAVPSLALELQRFLKLPGTEAEQAAESFLNPSYSEVAITELLRLAREIKNPPAPTVKSAHSRIRPIEEDRKRWNPHDGGLAPDDLQTDNVPPAIARANRHAVEHRLKTKGASR